MKPDYRLLALLKPFKGLVTLHIAFSLLNGLCIICQAYILSKAIHAAFLEQQTLEQGGYILLGFFLSASVIRWMSIWAGSYTGSVFTTKIKCTLRSKLRNHWRDLPLGARTRMETGKMLQLYMYGIESLHEYFCNYLPQWVLAIALPLSILCVTLGIDLLSSIVLLITAPLIPFFMILIGAESQQRAKKRWVELSRMAAWFLDVIQGLFTLKQLGRSKQQFELIRQINQKYRILTMDVLKIAFLSALVLELVATVSVAVVAVQVGLRLLYGYIIFQHALFILILAPEFYQPLRQLSSRFHAAITGISAAQELFDVFQSSGDTGQLSQSGYFPCSTGKQSNSIRDTSGLTIIFDSVSTSYTYRNSPLNSHQSNATIDNLTCSENQKAVLHSCSFKIKANTLTVLLGPSGAGKSSILQLLMKQLYIESGKIFINEQSLDSLGKMDWLSNVSWVAQHPYIFHDTIESNLRMGNTEFAQADLENAVRLACLEDAIRLMPMSYSTRIGEQGYRLSGGEKQRLALARAFLHPSKLLILDECTSHLDSETERTVMNHICALCNTKTIIFSAHRLYLAHFADLVIIIQNGRIVESGSPAELVKQPGVFAKMIQDAQDFV